MLLRRRMPHIELLLFIQTRPFTHAWHTTSYHGALPCCRQLPSALQHARGPSRGQPNPGRAALPSHSSLQHRNALCACTSAMGPTAACERPRGLTLVHSAPGEALHLGRTCPEARAAASCPPLPCSTRTTRHAHPHRDSTCPRLQSQPHLLAPVGCASCACTCTRTTHPHTRQSP